MIDSRSTKAYKLEKENRELKKEIKNLIELCNKYEESISLKQRNEKAIRRISIVRMDEDTTIETHKALDFVLQALIGADKE